MKVKGVHVRNGDKKNGVERYGKQKVCQEFDTFCV